MTIVVIDRGEPQATLTKCLAYIQKQTQVEKEVVLRQLLVYNILNFARLFVMTSASICACNPTKLRA